MAYKSSSLTAAGDVTVRMCDQPNNQDNVAEIQLSGDFATAVGTFQTTLDTASSSTLFANVPGTRVDTGSIETTPTLTDATTRKWQCNIAGAQQFQFHLTSIGSGTITVMISTYYVPGGLGQINSQLASSNQAVTITSSSANALAVGPNGTTNPTLKVNSSTASAAGGLSITGAADAVGVAVAAIGSNTNEPLTLDAKGSGTVSIATSSTGGSIARIKVATVAVGGTAIGNANAVGEGYYYVTGADNTAAVILPASVVGKQCWVKNTVTNKILIMFPPASSQINANGANNAYNIPAGAERKFTCVSTTLWYTDPETIV